MKSKLLFISCIVNIGLCFMLISAFKNSDEAKPGEKYFIAEYTAGKMWNQTLDFSEQNYAMAHSRFLSSLRQRGVVNLGARYADKGIIIFSATDLQSARNLMKNDTAVRNHLFDVEVNKIFIFYNDCIQSHLPNTEKK